MGDEMFPRMKGFHDLSSEEEMEEYIQSCARKDAPEDVFRRKYERRKDLRTAAFARCDGYLKESFYMKAMSGHIVNPERDSMILLGLAYRLNFDEFRQMLEIYGLLPLYIRDLRDAVIMKCIKTGAGDIDQVNQELKKHNLETFEFTE